MNLWWFPLTVKDAFDILLLAGFLYYSYRLLRNSGSKALFMGIVAFFATWTLISQILQMHLMGTLLDKFVNVGFLILIIIFQDDIKKFLIIIGSANKWSRISAFLTNKKTRDDNNPYISNIILSCKNLARKKTGALIVIQRHVDLSPWMHAGERFTSDVNARLIENIFFKNSPMHDGAMLIAGEKIRAAGVILPIANNPDLNKDLGLRHRAALGLSQKTDSIIIIISEERGHISVAHLGEITTNISIDDLQSILEHD